MRKGLKSTKLIYGAAIVGALTITVSSALAGEIGPDTAAGAQKLQGAQLQCSPNDYMIPGTPPHLDQARYNTCMSCKNTVEQQKNTVSQARSSAIQENNAVVGAGAAGTSATSAAANGHADNAENSAGATHNIGSSAQGQRSALAQALAQKAQTCSSQVQSACSGGLAGGDIKGAQSASDGCDEIAKASTANSAEKAASSGGMGDLSQLAGALGQALGPLAQMMQGQQGSSDYTPYDSGVSTVNTMAGTDLSTTPGAVDGTGIGNTGSSTNGVDFKSPKTNITGFGPASGSFGPSSSSMGAAGTDYASGGSDSADVGNTGYSAGASAGSLNSSGSSMAPGGSDAEKAAAAAAAETAGEGLEYNAGAGGGSKPSFLGLKSRSPEDDLASTDGGVLGDLGLGEDANRELASNEEGAGIGEEDGNTLFHVVHTKIAEIKRRGSI